MEELSAKALSGGEERGYPVERGRQPKGYRRERGYSSDRERAERGHSSEREENSGYGLHTGGTGHSGYSSSTEREGPGGYGVEGDRGHRTGVSGRSITREKEDRYSQNRAVSLPMGGRVGQRGEQLGVARDTGFPVGHEEHGLGRERMGTGGHSWAVREREAGGPWTAQSLGASGAESLRDASYSSTVVSQANVGFGGGLAGSAGGKSGVTQGPGRPGDAQADVGTARRPLGPTAQAESLDTSGMNRQSELQYYIAKVSHCRCPKVCLR